MAALLDQEKPGFDSKLLTAFLYELNIARRYVQSYPANHPNIVTSTLKVLHHLGNLLLNHDEIMIGVARNSLLLDSGELARSNPVYRDLAEFLFVRGVAAISFQKHLPIDELTTYTQCVIRTPEQLKREGGIANVLQAAGVTRIRVQEIDYSAFRVTEEATITAPPEQFAGFAGMALWSRFVQGMIAGNLDPEGRLHAAMTEIDPESLASFMNEHTDRITGPAKVSYEQAIATFLRQDDSKDVFAADTDSIDKLGTFVKSLNPALRSQFLRNAIGTNAGHAALAKQLISHFPDDVILEALDDVNQRGVHLSQGVINFLQATTRHNRTTGRSGSAVHETVSEEELAQKLRFMFREDDPGRFTPVDYQKSLKNLVAGRADTVLDAYERDALRSEIELFPIERQICELLLQTIDQQHDAVIGEQLQRRLLEFCELFISTGNFKALASIHSQLSSQCHGASFGFLPIHEAVLEGFVQPEFIEEVLNSLTVWGKVKYDEIQSLIDSIGQPFVEPIFQRLIEENNMSLRRFYLDRLLAQGDVTRDAAIFHLQDSRWFVVRNSIFLLRGLGNPAVLRHFRQIIDHPHPKVRQEVLKTLAHFRHPEVDRILLRELASKDHEIRLLAIQVAEQSRDAQIIDALRTLLHSKGTTTADIELKVAAVRALGKIGNRLVVTDIERLLSTKAVLRSGGLQRLKLEVVGAVEQFPSHLAKPVLERVVKKGPTELMPLARDILQRLEGHVQ